jgi:hypothetical protein
MTVDAIKAASTCSDYVVTSRSKELITLFLSYMQVELVTNLIALTVLWVCVHHVQHDLNVH